MRTDICCIGHITHDVIITPDSCHHLPGGTAFYFSKALNRLPKHVSFCTVTAMAADGDKIVDGLKHEGINIRKEPSASTICFENRYGNSPDDRTQRVTAKADPFTSQSVDGIDAQVYHLGSLLNDDFPLEMVEDLAKRGRVSIDAQGFLRKVEGENVYPCDWEGKEKYLKFTHYLKVNESEMYALTGTKSPLEAAKLIASWGVKELAITLGGEGSVIFADGVAHRIPAYKPKEMVDPTGCGDTYSAGYLYKRLQGSTIDEAGRFAAAMCTLKLECNGPFNATEADVVAVMSTFQHIGA